MATDKTKEYLKSQEAEGDQGEPEEQPEIKIKRAGPLGQESIKEAEGSSTDTAGDSGGTSTDIKSMFPKIGESMDRKDGDWGELDITELQLPEVKDLKQGAKYSFSVEAVVTDSRIRQDSKYDDKKHESVAISDPYVKVSLKITGIKVAGSGNVEKKEDATKGQATKARKIIMDSGENQPTMAGD